MSYPAPNKDEKYVVIHEKKIAYNCYWLKSEQSANETETE
jgi:hypothetical protein